VRTLNKEVADRGRAESLRSLRGGSSSLKLRLLLQRGLVKTDQCLISVGDRVKKATSIFTYIREIHVGSRRPSTAWCARVNDRPVLNGIFWALRSGAPWRELLEK
jgi:hypothetical protein